MGTPLSHVSSHDAILTGAVLVIVGVTVGALGSALASRRYPSI